MIGESIEAWVTDLQFNVLGLLDRSTASPFRKFQLSLARNKPGSGSLDYHLHNAMVAADPDLLDPAAGRLVWMRFRGKMHVWLLTEQSDALNDTEALSDWRTITGGEGLRFLSHRFVQPTYFAETVGGLDCSTWGAAWTTTLDGSAASGQKVVPVTATTGAVAGMPCDLIGSSTEIGVIASVAPGVSVTLVDDLAHSYVAGDRAVDSTQQWWRVVNQEPGQMLADFIAASNGRDDPAGLRVPQISPGTIETTGVGWTQDFRFDNVLDIASAIVAAGKGEVEIVGAGDPSTGLSLVFNFYAPGSRGSDLSATVIIEEAADLKAAEHGKSIRSYQTSDQEAPSYIVAEGMGEGVTAKLAVSQRATGLRVEAYLDAKDAGNVPLIQAEADGALADNVPVESYTFEAAEGRSYLWGVPYGADATLPTYDLCDTIRYIAPSRGINVARTVEAVTVTEGDDERIHVLPELGAPSPAGQGIRNALNSAARSLGRRMQPQGQLVPFSIADSVYFDTATPAVTGFYIPSRVNLAIECRVAIDFDQYPMPVSAAASGGGTTATSASGGGSTSGASSTSTSGGGAHYHRFGEYLNAAPVAFDWRHYQDAGGTEFNLAVTDGAHLYVGYEYGPAGSLVTHTHDIAHNHSTPNHTHDTTVPDHTHALTATASKEAYPASHSVNLTVYKLAGAAWVQQGSTITGITTDAPDIDLTAYVTGPGRWRIVLQSAAAQPNDGRIGAHLSGFLVGVIQSS